MYKSVKPRRRDVIATVYDRIAREPIEPVWISVASRDTATGVARKLERDPLGPVRSLYGVPFAIKDNIDLAGLPTTAAAIRN